MGRSLGAGFVRAGHDVKIGTRHPDKPELQEWRKVTKGKGSVGSFADAAAHGEVLLLCTVGAAVREAIDQAGLGTSMARS